MNPEVEKQNPPSKAIITIPKLIKNSTNFCLIAGLFRKYITKNGNATIILNLAEIAKESKIPADLTSTREMKNNDNAESVELDLINLLNKILKKYKKKL